MSSDMPWKRQALQTATALPFIQFVFNVYLKFVKTNLRRPLGSFRISKSGIGCREAILLTQVPPVAQPCFKMQGSLKEFTKSFLQRIMVTSPDDF